MIKPPPHLSGGIFMAYNLGRPYYHGTCPSCDTQRRPDAGEYCARCGRSLRCHWVWPLLETVALWSHLVCVAALGFYLLIVAAVIVLNIL